LVENSLANIDEIIQLSHNNQVDYIINSGVNMKTNQEILALSNKHYNMFITLGIHPEYEDSYLESDIKFIENNLQNKKVIAIGEIGLDYHYDGYNKQRQIELFCKQLELAEKYRLPVVIHSRDAVQDTLNILKKYKLKGVIHSFSGSLETAKEYIKMGYKLGINGVVTFKNAHIKEVVRTLGIENFLLETDSPYLTPEPYRGKKNFPGNIKHIVSFLEEYLELSSEEISKITNENVMSIFDKIQL